MFGLKTRRSVRNETFSPSRIRGAALAGLGVLAWRWFRNRQASNNPTTTNPNQSFSGTSTRPGSSY
jgi:hypothetical protein